MSNYHIDDFSDIMLETIQSGGEVILKTHGISMVPLLLNGKDSVVLKARAKPLKKNDVPFCRLDNGKYLLHRVMKILPDGNYLLRGDNNFQTETVDDRNVLSIAVAFVRKGKRIETTSLKYRLYCLFLPLIRPLWRSFWKVADAFTSKKSAQSENDD